MAPVERQAGVLMQKINRATDAAEWEGASSHQPAIGLALNSDRRLNPPNQQLS